MNMQFYKQVFHSLVKSLNNIEIRIQFYKYFGHIEPNAVAVPLEPSFKLCVLALPVKKYRGIFQARYDIVDIYDY